jgi:hypothetical protein
MLLMEKNLKACVDDMALIAVKNQLLQNLKNLFQILKQEKDLTQV